MCDKEYHFSKFYWEHRSKCFKTSAETATQLPLPGPSRTSLMGDRPWMQGPATRCSFLGAHKAQGLDYRGVLQSGATLSVLPIDFRCPDKRPATFPSISS